MPIPIRDELVHSLIRRRYGSVDNLVVEWEYRVASGAQCRGAHRDRGTVYRWLKHGVPARANDIFGLAALLDVDPVALLAIDGRYIEEHYGKERRLFRLNKPKGTPLASLWPLYAAETGWPNQRLAEAFYGRRWHLADFAHDPAVIANAYAALIFGDTCADAPAVPRTYHFAYRRAGVSDRMWRPYGAVIGFETEIVLISEAGSYQVAERVGRPVAVETYFGLGPAEFRVVSLHEFDLTVESPSAQRGCVRFLA